MGNPNLIALTKAQMLIGIIMSVVGPFTAGVVSYFNSISEIKAEMGRNQLEAEKSFVKKEDFERFEDKIDLISNDVSRIKGLLERQK